MGEALMQVYETMTESEQNELYDFAMFIVSRRKKRASSREEFSELLCTEDTSTLMPDKSVQKQDSSVILKLFGTLSHAEAEAIRNEKFTIREL